MPAASYASTARSHTHPRELADVKPVWRSSVAAMVTRSYQLGLLSFEQRAAPYRFISRAWAGSQRRISHFGSVCFEYPRHSDENADIQPHEMRAKCTHTLPGIARLNTVVS